MLVMTSIIRVGQSKFVTHPIDEDSQERILNCINTLSDLEVTKVAEGAFLDDTKSAYTKMLAAQEVSYHPCLPGVRLTMNAQKKAAEKKEADSPKEVAVQVDDLLTFRQFNKKGADDVVDVSR
jgi:coatomer subunit beta